MSRIASPLLAVTSGDPAGVGPEIVASFLSSYRPRRSVACVIGAPAAFDPVPRSWVAVDPAELAETGRFRAGQVLFVDSGCRARYRSGRDSRGGGAHAGRALEMACRLAGEGVVAAIVTAPISKSALNLAGYEFAGHTEMLATYFKAIDCQMVMVHGDFRVVPVTRHVPIARVARGLTPDRIVAALQVVDRALRDDFAVSDPHLAVAALNPHAGDAGVIGREEIEVIVPALRRVRRRGIRVTGPVPADALFQEVESGTFDAFVTMYHDQGLIPFKMKARRRGVNVTVGLPVIRTSVDHGVAYDIAGRGVASTVSLGTAYRLAEKLARQRIISQRR